MKKKYICPYKNNKVRITVFCFAFFLAGLPLEMISFADSNYHSTYLNGSWQKDEQGWWFSNKHNPPYPTLQWGLYRGDYYYFNANGYMVTGWQMIDDHWYYFNPEIGSREGAMVTGWIYDPDYNGWFYTTQSGVLATGWYKLDGYWYYFNPDPDGTMGIMITDQVIDDVYIDSRGHMNED